MALKDLLGSNIVQGLMGNLSEVSAEQLYKEYSSYLMNNEDIVTGFKLIRDAIIITSERILFFDKQGTTGQKIRVTSINISTVIDVTAETAGFGFDDSELTISYITSPNLKSHAVLQTASKKFEFPKKYNIQPLYRMLQELAHENFKKINS
ncbi:MAG: PH domain-containing protein [Ruminiclostridium sp.]